MKDGVHPYQISGSKSYNPTVHTLSFFEKIRATLTYNPKDLGELAESGSIIQALLLLFVGSRIVRDPFVGYPFTSYLTVFFYAAMVLLVAMCLVSPLTMILSGIEDRFRILKGYITLTGFSSIWFPIIILVIRPLDELVALILNNTDREELTLAHGSMAIVITVITLLLVLKVPLVGLSRTSIGVSKSRWIVLLPALLIATFITSLLFFWIFYPISGPL